MFKNGRNFLKCWLFLNGDNQVIFKDYLVFIFKIKEKKFLIINNMKNYKFYCVLKYLRVVYGVIK